MAPQKTFISEKDISIINIMDLTPYDQIMLRQITRFMLCFKLDQHTKEDDVLRALRKGLARTISQIPFLSGSVEYGEHRNMVSVVYEESKEVMLRVAHLHHEMPEYDELCEDKIPLSALKEHLLSPLPNFINPKKKSQPIFSIQANLLKGGLILCVCVHHSVMDGVGQGLLMTALAANCTLASDPSNKIAGKLASQFNYIKDEISSRGRLFADIRKEDGPQGHDYQEYHIPDPSTVSPIDNIAVAPCTARLFSFSDNRLKELKRAIMENIPVSNSDRTISTNDAFGALAWHCITLARIRAGKLTADQTSKLVIPIDCRNHLQSYGLPKPYLGNACICLVPSLPVEKIVNSDTTGCRPLASLAPLSQLMRSTITNLSKAYILGLGYHANTFSGDINTMKPRMQSYLGPDITYVSWADFKLHNLNFGSVLGTMDYFRCPYRALDGVVKVLPRGKGADWEVVVEMEIDVMDELLREDGEWMKWVQSVTY